MRVSGPGSKKVIIIHHEGADDEARIEASAKIQPNLGFFSVTTPIYEGDVVEIPDPRGGIDRRVARRVDVYDAGSRAVQHIEVHW